MLVAVCAAAVLPADLRSELRAPTQEQAYARALAAYAQMRSAFRDGRARYHEREDSSGYAHAWPLGEATAASLEMVSLTGGDPKYVDDAREDLQALAAYRGPAAYESSIRPPFGPGGAPFFDDNEWIGLDLVRAYDLLGDQRYLRQAAAVFRFVASGWDRNATNACPGGIFWTRDPANTDRNAVSTANGALLGAELYLRTGLRSDLHWAQAMYAWVTACLTGSDGLIQDHLSPTGERDERTWSYNQGAMIAAGALLAKATGLRSYLDRARALAATALRAYVGSGFAGQPPFFVAVFFRDLRVLDGARLSSEHVAASCAYAAQLPAKAATLLDQAATVELYAVLSAGA